MSSGKLTEPKARILSPALVSIVGLTCQTGGAGMGMLTATIKVLITEGETLQSLDLKVNGNPANNAPSLQAGSPTMPIPGTKLYTYDWNEPVACGATYDIMAVVGVTLTKDSGVYQVTCAQC